MSDKNCELLFEYLKSILFDPVIEELDVEKLDEPYQKLGRGMQFLQHTVEEMLAYSAEISQGNLSAEFPSKDNFLCVNLKNMHANLNHLTWQAKQVASGDYSQQVSYLGEFSEAFNSMTIQLKEREEQLRQEAIRLRKRAESIEAYNELLRKVAGERSEWVFVVEADTKCILYCNKSRSEGAKYNTLPCENCSRRDLGREEILKWKGSELEVWELKEKSGKYLRISSYPVEWQERNAYVHVVTDITEARQEKERLSNKMYFDPGTSVRNRLFFEEYMEQILAEKKEATLCYMDVDNLKYVNDHYGHLEGDNYLRAFTELLNKYFRRSDVIARIGGDEFCLILPGSLKELALRKLKSARTEFQETHTKDYSRGFSYGVYEINGATDGITLKEIIREADSRMYKYKRKYKEKEIKDENSDDSSRRSGL